MSIAGFAATSKAPEAYGADEPKAPAFSEISYIQISDPPEFVSKYANDLADDRYDMPRGLPFHATSLLIVLGAALDHAAETSHRRCIGRIGGKVAFKSAVWIVVHV